jgi:hypothetical protein
MYIYINYVYIYYTYIYICNQYQYHTTIQLAMKQNMDWIGTGQNLSCTSEMGHKVSTTFTHIMQGGAQHR